MKKDPRLLPSIILEETGSTNDDVERLVASELVRGEDISRFHGYSELAFAQTAGRGRFERVWDSAFGGFYQSTLVVMEKLAPTTPNMLIVAVSAALFRAVRGFSPPGRAVEIKWPNDIVADGKKVAGILMKSAPRGGVTPVIIGTGANLFNDVAPERVRTGSTLPPGRIMPDRPDDRLVREGVKAFSEFFLREFWAACDSARDGAFDSTAAEYSKNLMYVGREVEVFDAVESGSPSVRGVFAGVTEEGYLRVTAAGGNSNIITSGEIRVTE